jgi:proline dehydrogenase
MQSPAEREILEVGRRLLTSADSSARGPVRALDERAIERASQDAELRAALLRFVDVAPACRSPADAHG